MNKKIFVLLCATCLSLYAFSFDKSTYYSRADGKKGSALKTALCGIIYSHTARSYDNLWTDFRTTDCRADGKVWDMYSSTTNYTFGTDQAGNYKAEGDVYNREHSFPKSWFDDATPMYTDLYHLYPTDGYVNGRRSNYCFGEVASASYSSNEGFSKLGTPSQTLKSNGCSEKLVFEPNDIYKGDFARTYFYMVTAYENQLTGWSGCGMLDKSTYPAFTSWAKILLLQWAEGDPVSEKETNRIEAVYNIQSNRNPYIDFPGLEQYIWGSWQDSTFCVNDYRNPYEYGVSPSEPNTPDTPIDPEEPENPDTPAIGGMGDYVLLTSEPSDWTGQYLIGYRTGEMVCLLNGALSSLDANGNYISATEEDGVIHGTETVNAASFLVEQTSEAGFYSIQSVGTNLYMGHGGKKNGLTTSESFDEALGNQLQVSSTGNATITGTGSYVLQFNNADDVMRFRYYKSGTQSTISLYRQQMADGISAPENHESSTPVYYDLSGRRLVQPPHKGIYICNGKKVLR